MHTKSNYFLVIPVAEVIIKHLATRCWTHLLCLRGDWVDIRPTLFWCFTICSSNTLSEIEWESSLTGSNMSWQMELWDEECDFLTHMVKMEVVGEHHHAFSYMDAPLADDVIWHYESGEFSVGYTREEEIVHISISSRDNQQSNGSLEPHRYWLFAFLKVTNRVWLFHIVPNAVNHTDTRDCQVCRVTSVSVFDSMVFNTSRFLIDNCQYRSS